MHANSTTPVYGARMSVLDTIISRLAARQHGVVALWQLTALGIEASAARRRVADGRLRRVHRGVYAVGPLDRKGYWMAAVLACGEGALLSHRNAAALWNLRQTNRTAIDVTAPGTRRRRRPRITVHGTGEIHPDDRAESMAFRLPPSRARFSIWPKSSPSSTFDAPTRQQSGMSSSTSRPSTS